MTSHDWTLALDAGPVHITTSSTATTAVLPAVLSGFRTGWSTPDADVWPVQPEAQVCVFSLLAYDAADLAGIDLGSKVHAVFTAGYVDSWNYDPPQVVPSVEFAGTVGALSGVPIRFEDPANPGVMVDGWRLDVQAVDYTAQLSGYAVGGPWLSMTFNGHQPGDDDNAPAIGFPMYASQWLAELLAQAGLPADDGVAGSGAFWNGATWPYGGPKVLPLADGIEPGPFADAAEDLLRQVPEDSQAATAGFRRGILRPKLALDGSGTLDPDLPYRVEWISRRNPSTTTAVTLPAKLALLTGGKYGPQLAPLPVGSSAVDATLTVSSDYLDRSVSWSRDKAGEPERVIVTSKAEKTVQQVDATNRPWSTATTEQPGASAGAITAKVEDTALDAKADALNLGSMYLSDTVADSTVWQPVGFSWRASEDPSWPRPVSWFPAAADTWRGWAVPVVITDVPASQSPDGRPWHVGVPQSVDLVIEGGAFRFDFTLRNHQPRPYNNNAALTCTNLRAALPTLTVAQLDRSYTHADYRLVRSPALS